MRDQFVDKSTINHQSRADFTQFRSSNVVSPRDPLFKVIICCRLTSEVVVVIYRDTL